VGKKTWKIEKGSPGEGHQKTQSEIIWGPSLKEGRESGGTKKNPEPENQRNQLRGRKSALSD